MKKRLLLVALCLWAVSAQAFGPPRPIWVDYDSVAVAMRDHREIYDGLCERFVRADTTLTLEECALVYYGTAFLPGYNSIILDGDLAEAARAGDHERLKSLAAGILEENPVYLRALFHYMGALHAQGDSEWKDYMWRFFALCRVIMASGDGTSPATAWKVICIPDEYEILFKVVRARKFVSQALITEPVRCDVMTVLLARGEETREVKFYFDISAHLVSLQNQLQ